MVRTDFQPDIVVIVIVVGAVRQFEAAHLLRRSVGAFVRRSRPVN